MSFRWKINYRQGYPRVARACVHVSLGGKLHLPPVIAAAKFYQKLVHVVFKMTDSVSINSRWTSSETPDILSGPYHQLYFNFSFHSC